MVLSKWDKTECKGEIGIEQLLKKLEHTSSKSRIRLCCQTYLFNLLNHHYPSLLLKKITLTLFKIELKVYNLLRY